MSDFHALLLGCAVQLLPLGSTSDWLPVVACRDCCIRVMGMDGKPQFEIATGSPPTAVRQAVQAYSRLNSSFGLAWMCTVGRSWLKDLFSGTVQLCLTQGGWIMMGGIIGSTQNCFGQCHPDAVLFAISTTFWSTFRRQSG